MLAQTRVSNKEVVETISRAMRTFRQKRPLDKKVKSCAGYFYLPISVQGSAYHLPLGFLGTTGCTWAKQGGCTMCDYGGFASRPSDQEFVDQAEHLLECWAGLGPLKEVNLSALGSFFDEAELSPEARRGVLRSVASRRSIDLLGVESRPEFVTSERIEEAKAILGPRVRLEVGMGLESSNDFIRNVCINKRLGEADYLKAVDCLKNLRAGVTTHVLFKPPFLTEYEAIQDAVETINYAQKGGADRIVLMVSNVKDHTLTSWLLRMGLYRVPWLWGVLQTALEVNEEARGRLLIYGFRCGIPLIDRGRNCPVCTDAILSKIELFNFTGNAKHLKEALSVSCTCRESWTQGMDSTAFGRIPVPERVRNVCDLLVREAL